jgi:hypothetical protein
MPDYRKNNIRERTLWLTRTAIFVALLVMMQFLTSLFGNQFVTGSVVNLILILSVLLSGTASGLTVAIGSPIFAFMVGVGPVFPPVIPFMILGNIALVLVWYAMSKPGARIKAVYFLTPIVAAAVKFIVLYTGIVLIAIPYLLYLTEPQTAMISLMFSYPQLITALIGGVIALAIAPPLRKALKLR